MSWQSLWCYRFLDENAVDIFCKPREKSPHRYFMLLEQDNATCNRELVIIGKVTPSIRLGLNRSLVSDFGASSDCMMEMPIDI